MRNFFTSFKLLILSVFGLFLCAGLGAQTAPSFLEYNAEILVGRGSGQVVFIPQIMDNDGGTQTVTIDNVTLSNDTIVSVDSYEYDDTYNCGILYLTDLKTLGPVDITIDISDDGSSNTTFSGVITVEVVTYPTAAEDGVNYEYYNKAHWQPEPTPSDVAAPGSYEVITITNGPNENMAKDFFWQLMYGYIIPKVSGTYIFYCDENEGGTFRMNLGDGVSQDMADLTLLGENDTYASIITTDAVGLEAGKPYFFRFTGKDIVNSQPFWIKWAGPGFPTEDFITSEYLKTAVDFTNPTVPQNFNVVRRGDDFLYVGWNSSTDNNKIRGYNVYLDGVKIADEMTDTLLDISGLTPNTAYTICVEAIDNYSNTSGFATFLQETTYPTDGTAPNAPTNLMHTRLTSDAVRLVWDIPTDGETEIRGYNIYRDNVQINTIPILDNYYVDSELSPETSYDYEITALDGGLNESSRSNLYVITTTTFQFEADPPFSNNYKARVSFTTEAIDQMPGMAVQVGYNQGSMVSANKVIYGHFEDPGFSSLSLAGEFELGKRGDLSFNWETNDPYAGDHCARLSGAQGKFMDCSMSGVNIYGSTYTYRVRFAAKKDPLSTVNIAVTLNSQFNTNVANTTFTPTDDWDIYEAVLTPTFDDAATGWHLEFALSGGAGTIYLDEIEFHVEEHYIPGSKYSQIGIDLMDYFQPSGMRWGGIGANYENYYQSYGPWAGPNMSYADYINFCNEYCGGYSFFSIGCNSDVDWYTNANIFTKFIDYIAGDNSTTDGQARIAEGYTDLLTPAKEIHLEYGNEVWGFGSHQDAFANYDDYGTWCRNMEQRYLASSFFDKDIITTSYSGRSPSNNYGLHQDLLAEDDKEIDYLSLSGYMGGNLDYEPGIDFGEAVEDYHKNGYSSYWSLYQGLETTLQEVVRYTGRPMPFYMYEGNMTTTSYQGTVGQGVCMTDYYVNCLRSGVAHAVTFALGANNQWALLEDDRNYGGLPIWHANAIINQNCKGINLVTNVETNRTIKDSDGRDIGLPPIGAYAFYTDEYNDKEYAIALFNRDIQNDYQIQLDIPDEITVGLEAPRTVLTGTAIDSPDEIIIADTVTTFADSFVVTVPAYSMMVVTFNGDKQTYTNVPLTDMEYIHTTSVTIVPTTTTVIEEDQGVIILGVETAPLDAFVKDVVWEISDNTIGVQGGDYVNNQFLVKASGACGGNGTVTVRAYAVDDPTVYDEVVVTVTNQTDPGGCVNVEENSSLDVNVYPNPANNVLNVQLPEGISGTLSVTSVHGAEILKESITDTEMQIDINELATGVYVLQVESSAGIEMLRFIKE